MQPKNKQLNHNELDSVNNMKSSLDFNNISEYYLITFIDAWMHEHVAVNYIFLSTYAK